MALDESTQEVTTTVIAATTDTAAAKADAVHVLEMLVKGLSEVYHIGSKSEARAIIRQALMELE